MSGGADGTRVTDLRLDILDEVNGIVETKEKEILEV